MMVMFVDYAGNHASYRYRVINLSPKKKMNRDITWLGKSYGEMVQTKNAATE